MAEVTRRSREWQAMDRGNKPSVVQQLMRHPRESGDQVTNTSLWSWIFGREFE